MIVEAVSSISVYKKFSFDGNYWYAEFKYIDENDRKRKKYVRGCSKKDALEKAEDLIACSSKYRRQALEYKNYTFNEFCSMFLNDIHQNEVKPSTHSLNLRTLENNIPDHFKNMKMKIICSFDIQNVLVDLAKTHSDSIVKKVHSLIKITFEYYRSVTGECWNIMFAVRRPTGQKRTIENKDTYFTSPEMEEIRKVAIELTETKKVKYGYEIILIMFTGMREGEARALTWDDIDFNKKTIHIDKTVSNEQVDENGVRCCEQYVSDTPKTKHSIRAIPMHKYALEALNELYNNKKSNYVMAGVQNEILSYSALLNCFKKILDNCSFDSTNRRRLHILRHSFTCYLREEKVTLHAISKFLGHSSEEVTKKIYWHNQDEIAKKEWDESGLFEK